LHFRGGELLAGNRKLLEIPSGHWIRIKMNAALGQQARGTWDLEVIMNGDIRRFANLECDPKWRSARWVGFSSLSRGTQAVFLDDVVMELNP
jgi:hypothetical protein